MFDDRVVIVLNKFCACPKNPHLWSLRLTNWSTYMMYFVYSLPNLFFHEWPNPLLYAFTPIVRIPQGIRWIGEHRHRVLLVAPLWKNHHWISDLSQLLTAAPWPIPLRRYLLSQANRTICPPPCSSCAIYCPIYKSSVAHPPEAVPPLSGEQNYLPPPPPLCSSCAIYCPIYKSCWTRATPLPHSKFMWQL